MKKIISLFLIVISMWGVAFLVGDQRIELDPDLESFLQEEYGMNHVTAKRAKSINELDLSGLNLTSSKGLEHFTNLQRLDVSKNLLTDSSFLKSLDQLKFVNLSYNQFERVHFANHKIEKLNVRNNKLTDLEFASELPHLTYLNVRSNHISDLTPLHNLTNLQYLNIRDNAVHSIEPLKNLTSLTNINLRNNKIETIQPIRNLSLKERLYVTGNEIFDLKVLKKKIKKINQTDFDVDIPSPRFSEKSGIYNAPFTLELFSEDEDLEIYYTLDGKFPTINANQYDGPIEITKDLLFQTPVISNHKTAGKYDAFNFRPDEVKKAVTITAVAAYKPSRLKPREYSQPVTATYILDDTLVDRNNFPLVSLVVEPKDFFDYEDGIYVPGYWYEEDSLWSGNFSRRGKDHEKEADLLLFDQHGNIDFQQKIGIRINGRGSRRYQQKSLRLYARSEYGQNSFFTNVFDDLPYDKFNRLLLRNSGQDFKRTMMRDGLMHELVKDLEVDVQAYQPVIVLLNGEYWGIHNLREKFNPDYIHIKYNLNKKDLILMDAFRKGKKVDFEMKAGDKNDKKEYNDLIKFVRKNDLTNDDNLEYLRTKVDLNNFFHYVAFQIYFANTDSFSNNMMIWRKRSEYIPTAPHGHDGRWRWMLFDLDYGMGQRLQSKITFDGAPVEYNMVEHVMADERRMALFRETMKNERAQKQFLTIMLDLLNSNFNTERVHHVIDQLSEQIASEMPYSIKRWDNIASVEEWHRNLQTLYDFAEKRPTIVKAHLKHQFDLTDEMIKEIEKTS